LCKIDLHGLLARHHGGQAAATIAAVPANERTDGGGMTLDAQGRVVAFHEKAGGQYLNAGIYAIQTAVIGQFPESLPCSIERDIFPGLLAGKLSSYVCRAPLYDIGTPARLAEFQALQRGHLKTGSELVQPACPGHR
jgi:mannose-1-phosphate guanylyltransferase